ncbi:hypothetical protein H2508_08345 [Parahaliea sp. F7430]|uniref:Uncharacterized protein n=1 Tax=Sediminihaliea albiluteola TaxID=2758564 RepID=A0A7W2TW90_9GAMM|nr:hypothetical protein [Sediminihaliea albiluteola]MBA6413116.1 hypothetical protein [Sediminihaliea albiluteola]
MGTVLHFPSTQAQGLAFLDRELRQRLAAYGADQALSDFAATELTRIYKEFSQPEAYSFTLSLPDDLPSEISRDLQQQISEGLEGLRKENHALVINLIAQLVLARMQLFQLQRG